MKLNRAYTESLNNSLSIIQDFLNSITENEFTPKSFTEYIQERKIKYKTAWFPILRRVGVFTLNKQNKKYYYDQALTLKYDEIKDGFVKALISMKCNPYMEYGRSPIQNGFTKVFKGKNEYQTKTTDRASSTKEQPKSNTTLDEEAAIKLLASLGYSVFKFNWIHTTQVDKNAVKVIGYYKLNKA